MSDTQRLIDNTLPFVQDLLMKYGEFYPLASAVTIADSISQVGTYDGNDNPQSDKVILDLKRALRAKQADYKSVAIFYDVSVIAPDTNQKIDAVAVFVESQSDDFGCIIYYPYVWTENNKLQLTDNVWKERNAKEIFLS